MLKAKRPSGVSPKTSTQEKCTEQSKAVRRMLCIARIILILKQLKPTHFQVSLWLGYWQQSFWPGKEQVDELAQSESLNLLSRESFALLKKDFQFKACWVYNWKMTASMREAWDTSYTKEMAGKVLVLIYKEIKLSTLANILCSNWSRIWMDIVRWGIACYSHFFSMGELSHLWARISLGSFMCTKTAVSDCRWLAWPFICQE